MIEWFLTGVSLIGCWYNIQKKVISWFLWAFANLGWMLTFTYKGMLAEASLFAVYLLLSIYGIFKWIHRQPLKHK